MSLINQMLKDLEKRRSENEALSRLPPTVHYVDTVDRSPGFRGWLLLGVCALVAAPGVAYWWWESVERRDESVVAQSGLLTPSAPTPSTNPPPAASVTMPPAVAAGPDAVGPPAPETLSGPPAPPPTTSPAPVVAAPAVVNDVMPSVSLTTQPAPAAASSSPTPVPGAPDAPHRELPRQVLGLAPTPLLKTPRTADKTAAAPRSVDKSRATASAVRTPKLRGTASDRDDARSMLERGRRQLLDGFPLRAQADLQRALEIDPQSHEARLLLARTYLSDGDVERARLTLDADPSLSRDPQGGRLYAQIQLKSGDPSQAAAALDRAGATVAGTADDFGLMGSTRQRQGRHREAVDWYRKAVHADPGQARWWLGLAISLEALEHYDDAISAYREVLAAGAPSAAARAYVQSRLAELSGTR